MGGRITRALYKNQRQSSFKNPSQSLNQMRDLSVTFSLVMASVSSFLLGYLYRPHLFGVGINAREESNKDSPSQNDLLKVIIYFGVIQLVLFGYTFRKKNKEEPLMKSVQRNNRVLITVSVAVLIVDIFSWLLSYRLNWFFIIGYQLLWIGSSYICLLLFNNMQILTHRKQCKQKTNKNENANLNLHLKRTLFIVFMLFLFEAGLHSSQYMRQLRLQNAVKQIIQNQHLNSQSIKYFGDLSSIPLEYRGYVIDSSHEQKMVLRIMFSVLILMIGVTVIAFERKSMAHLIMFEKKSKELHQLYIEEINKVDEYKDVELIRSYGCGNLAPRRVLISTMIYLLGCILIENERQGDIYHTSGQKITQLNFKQNVIMISCVMLGSYLFMKGVFWLKQVISKKEENNKQNSNRMKNRSLIISTIICTILFQLLLLALKSLTFRLFEASTSQLTPNPLNNSIELYFTTFKTQLLLVFITFFYLRLTREELIRFPITSLQLYTPLSLTIIFTLKYIIPYTLISTISLTIYNLTLRPIIRLLTSIISPLITQTQTSIDSQYYICLQLFVFVFILLLILINDQRNIYSLLNQQKSENSSNSQQKKTSHYTSNSGSQLSKSQQNQTNYKRYLEKEKDSANIDKNFLIKSILSPNQILIDELQILDQSTSFIKSNP